jgi:hypothetical protein
LQQQLKLPIKLTLKAFSSGAWPTQNILELPLDLLPREIQHAQECIDEYSKLFMSKKTLKISGFESKIRWLYYFDSTTKSRSETCYFDTNCLQAILLYAIYRHRPEKLSLKYFEEALPKINPKLIRENIAKMVISPLLRPTSARICSYGRDKESSLSSASTRS